LINLKWIKIDIEIEDSYKPPFFTGSMIRGVFGKALKSTVCINPSYNCTGCFCLNKCIYYDFFEEKNSYHQYRIVSPLGQKELKFSIYLYENATNKLPYILSAVKKALETVGVGKNNITPKIKSINIDGTNIYNGKEFLSLSNIKVNIFQNNQEYYSSVKLQFLLPLRIKQQNRLSKDIELHNIINSIHNRINQIKKEPPNRLGYKVEGYIFENSLKFLDLQRYSNRQKSYMKLGGLIGNISIRGLDQKSYEYLKVGEIVGVGKQTVFGLGSYNLVGNASNFV